MPSPLIRKLIRHTGRLDRPAGFVAKAVDAFYKRARPVQSLVNGTWIGHAIHPLLTDVVIGAWTVVLAFDLIGLAVPDAGLATAAEIALWLGVLAAGGAVLTGLTDYKDAFGDEQRIGFLHALVMTVTTILYLASGLMRLAGPVDSTAARAVAIAGFILVTAGGYLGGEMTFGFGSMVNHNAFSEELGKFTLVGPLAELKQGLNRVSVKGRPVLLVRRGDDVVAIGAVCSHAGGPLDEGELHGDEVTCPWHGSKFRIADGQVRRGPATFPQPAYEVRVADAGVEVRSRAD
ncbi:MAG: Rieske 2Fe-2S domain-containing protein [Candidatus Limnocylindrales bacterium]